MRCDLPATAHNIFPCILLTVAIFFAFYQERHQAKTMAQIRTFVGKLPDLQQEHQSLRTRKYLG